MKIYSNEKLIKRNTLIGNITSLASIAVLGVGMFLSFKDANEGKYLTLSFTCLIVGFLLFQIGNYFMTRFGKPPRPDQKISQSLKGLDDKYTLYHYQTSIPHLLVGSSGIYCLMPYNQPGIISYNADKKRWKQSGGNFFVKTFGGESIGRPENDAQYSVSDAMRYFQKKGLDLGSITPEPVLVFTNEKASLNAEGYTGSAVTVDKLKEFIRKRAKNILISPEMMTSIQQAIEPK